MEKAECLPLVSIWYGKKSRKLTEKVTPGLDVRGEDKALLETGRHGKYAANSKRTMGIGFSNCMHRHLGYRELQVANRLQAAGVLGGCEGQPGQEAVSWRLP